MSDENEWDDLLKELKDNKKQRAQSYAEMESLSKEIKGFFSSEKITKFREYGPWTPITEIFIVPGIVDHWGIRTSHNRLIHYPGKSKNHFASYIDEVSIDEFVAGNKYKIYRVKPKYEMFTPEQVIERAISRLGEDDYNPITNNCEHFVHWCVWGESESSQVNNIRDMFVEVAALQLLKSAARYIPPSE